jgi:hypothetical protein
LLAFDHQRLDNRADRPVVFLLRFNQPIQPGAVLPHISARLQPHDWNQPALSATAEKLMAQQDPRVCGSFGRSSPLSTRRARHLADRAAARDAVGHQGVSRFRPISSRSRR